MYCYTTNHQEFQAWVDEECANCDCEGMLWSHWRIIGGVMLQEQPHWYDEGIMQTLNTRMQEMQVVMMQDQDDDARRWWLWWEMLHQAPSTKHKADSGQRSNKWCKEWCSMTHEWHWQQEAAWAWWGGGDESDANSEAADKELATNAASWGVTMQV